MFSAVLAVATSGDPAGFVGVCSVGGEAAGVIDMTLTCPVCGRRADVCFDHGDDWKKRPSAPGDQSLLRAAHAKVIAEKNAYRDALRGIVIGDRGQIDEESVIDALAVLASFADAQQRQNLDALAETHARKRPA